MNAENLCPECGDYAPVCLCAMIDEIDYPCYACGEESTHEIQHRGGWLYVCDDPACVGEPEFWSWEDRAADDAGMSTSGPL